MSNKITFKSWLTNLGKGLWQAICWVGRCLNPKYKTLFWRVIWSVLTICVIVCTCIITRVWYQAEREQLNRFGEKQRISKQLVFMKASHSDKPGIIKNVNTGALPRGSTGLPFLPMRTALSSIQRITSAATSTVSVVKLLFLPNIPKHGCSPAALRLFRKVTASIS